MQQIDTRKQIWLITYGAACNNITHDMLKENGVNLDQCYTMVWRESKYTLFHCAKTDRVSSETLKRVTKTIEDRHGIIFNASVLGYDALCSNDKIRGESLEDHPGFRRMTELLNTGSEDLNWWIEGEKAIHTYRKGLLWKYIDSTDPEKMTPKQLVSRVKSWTPIVQAHKTLKAAYTANLIDMGVFYIGPY